MLTDPQFEAVLDEVAALIDRLIREHDPSRTSQRHALRHLTYPDPDETVRGRIGFALSEIHDHRLTEAQKSS